MHCARCGSPIAPNAAFCSSCGAPVAVGVHAQAVKRPPIVTLLAVLQFIGGGFWLLGAVFGLVSAVIGSGDPRGDAFTLVIAAICGVLGGLQLTCGAGLWNLKPIGRTLQRIFSFIGLLGIPFGTVISILILVYLNKPGIKVLFSGRPSSDWTQEEMAWVAAIPQSSAAVVVVIALVAGVFVIASLGIVAAIAVPALLRARISANEASAIGALRAIISAETSFASSCSAGGYAVTLDDLAKPPRDASTAFISPDLGSNGVIKAGFRIAITRDAAPGVSDVGTVAATCNGSTSAPATSYFASAEPVTLGGTGTRYFATDARGIIVSSSEQITNPIVASPALVPVQ